MNILTLEQIKAQCRIDPEMTEAAQIAATENRIVNAVFFMFFSLVDDYLLDEPPPLLEPPPE